MFKRIRTRHGIGNRLMAGVAAAAITVIAPSASATAQSTVVTFSIARQSLAGALNEVALQSGRQLVLDGALVRDRQTTGLRGAYTLESALDHLLRGTELTYSVRGNTVVIRRGRNAVDPAHRMPAALTQDIEVRFEGPEDGDAGLRAVGNPVLMGELLGNLLDNAIRYNRPGGTVTVRVGPGSGTGPVMEVEDDGPGIPEAERERVFERFYRLDRPGEPPGTGSGLGLAIVRALADRLGAAVRLDAGQDGRGLKVTVTLRPAEKDAASKRPTVDQHGA